VGFLGFCGLLIWAVLLLMPPKAACLVPIYAGYEENLAVPQNLYGRNGIQDLVKLTESGVSSFFWGSGAIHLKNNPAELRTDDAWDKDLGQFKEKTVIVFFAVHGGADPHGAYLLPANSNGRPDEKNRLRLEKILDRLAEINKDKNKVLILDATQVSAHWPLGMLHNGFARELEKLESKIAAIPNLIVLSASEADQRSWVSEEWRQTVFAHFVIEGLKGDADESRGGRINALNLSKYVQKKVENWVRSNRDASQRPVLLPRGERGENLARNMDLVVIKDAYQAPNPRELPSFEPPPELLAAWKNFQDLDKSVPSPAVYSPYLWRQYQEFLIRYEQALRGGDKGMASTLLGKVNDLEQAIKQARSEDLISAQNTLPMPAAAGLGRIQPDLFIKSFNELLDATDQARTWESIQKSGKANTKSERQLLRVQMGELLVRWVAEDPATRLERGAKLALAIEDPASPRPAEMHFLIMLNRDRPSNPDPAAEYFARVKMALELRLLAEKVSLSLSANGHPYSERIYARIRSPMEVADESRRFGQDLLFASSRLSWSEARKSFQAAEKKYQEAQEIGQAVRAGLAARDLAYEVLPALSQWAALRRPSGDTQRQNGDAEMLRSIEDLWREVHRLDKQLEKPNSSLVKDLPKADLDDPQPLNLPDRTKIVTGGLAKLRSQFDAVCQRLSISADLQIDWHDAEGALTVPFMDPTLRMKLITNSRRTSLDLLTKVGDKPAETAAVAQKEEELTQKEASRQGRMALAALGKGWFDQCKSQAGELETFEQVHSRINTLVAAPNWAESLVKAEDQVGIRWQQMPMEIIARAEAAPKSKLDQALGETEFADRLARILDAGSSRKETEVGGLMKSNPVEEYRRLLFLGLLDWQAQRTFGDHWFDLDPNPDQPPYYRVAGTAFLDDARKLVPQQDRLQPINNLQQTLNKPGRLLVEVLSESGQPISGPARLNITSEQKFRVTYRIRPPKDEVIPNGFPVAGVKIGKDLQFISAGEGDRTFHELTGKDQPLAPISVNLRSPLLEKSESNPPARPDPVLTTIALDGIYRGQRIVGDTRVNLYPLPEIAQVQTQKPEKGSLAVRAHPDLLQQFAPNRGAIAIVLDCSGSMWFPHEDKIPYPSVPAGTKAPDDSRFVKAVGALESVLGEVVPQGTTVGLWIFSQHNREGEEKITQLWPLGPWDRQKDLQGLMDKIRDLVPYYHTPLVEAIWEAKKGLERNLSKDFKGFKSVVVLTDGADDRFPQFAKREKLNTRTIREFMEKEFLQDSRIMLNMVFFQVDPKEKQEAEEAFGIIEDKKWKVPGKMIFVKEDPKELKAALRRALRQSLRYWVENPDGTAPADLNDSLEVSASGSNDQYVPKGLPPGGYNVWVQTADRNLQKILLERGDLLLMQLNKDLKFERLVPSKEDYPERVSLEKEGWRMAALQNQKIGDRGLQLLTTLERLTERTAITLQQVKPQDVWFEIQPPATVSALYGTRYGYHFGYPAAAWSFDIPEWPLALGTPNLASPQIRAWFSPDQEAASSAVLQQGADFTSGAELMNRPIQVEGDKVMVESVSIENHLVEVERGQKRVSKPCLVVRLAYPKDKPIWTKISGSWNVEGSEHRFYQDANKYTGIFWPAPPNAAESLAKLSFISVPVFKREAERRGFMLDLKDAGVPEARNDRPSPRFNFFDRKN
jgi:hypothetical protein